MTFKTLYASSAASTAVVQIPIPDSEGKKYLLKRVAAYSQTGVGPTHAYAIINGTWKLLPMTRLDWPNPATPTFEWEGDFYIEGGNPNFQVQVAWADDSEVANTYLASIDFFEFDNN